MPEHSELRQLHLVAHPDASEAVAPVVPYIAHCVPDFGDMSNTQNAITYAAEPSPAQARLAAATLTAVLNISCSENMTLNRLKLKKNTILRTRVV